MKKVFFTVAIITAVTDHFGLSIGCIIIGLIGGALNERHYED